MTPGQCKQAHHAFLHLLLVCVKSFAFISNKVAVRIMAESFTALCTPVHFVQTHVGSVCTSLHVCLLSLAPSEPVASHAVPGSGGLTSLEVLDGNKCVQTC